MRIYAYGRDALLVELRSLDQVVQFHAHLREEPPSGLLEVVPGARTLLIAFDRTATTGAGIALAIRSIRARSGPGNAETDPVEIPIRYDGPDMAEVEKLTHLSRVEVIHRHVEGRYTVAFTGIAPGFYFLSGGHRSLQVPRRGVPHTSVETGAVGLAGEFTGIYPRTGPGGWQIIGHTTARLWDVDKLPSVLLAPTTPVRFVQLAE